MLEDPNEIRGINSRSELAEASRIVRQKKNEELMAAGVTIEDPATTYIDDDVVVGADTVIHPGVHLEGKTQIGQACEIHAGVRIVNSVLDDRVTVQNFCVINGGRLAHRRHDRAVRAHPARDRAARVGAHRQFRRAEEDRCSARAPRPAICRTWATRSIGESVNIGAGTITCNYDGEQKHQTTIEDGAFVGSDSQLVAPVTIGKGAYVGSGTTVRENVPAGRARGERRASSATSKAGSRRRKQKVGK